MDHSRPGAGLRLGDHVCWAYSGEAERRSVLSTYFRDGLAAGQRLAYYGARGTEDRIADYLGPDADVDALIGQGRLLVAPAEEVYTPGGRFDPDDRIRAYTALVVQAVADGHPGLRVFADAGWLLPLLDDVVTWCEYELRADLLAGRLPFTALCGFDVGSHSGLPMGLVDAVHRGALGDRVGGFHLHGLADGRVGLDGEVDFTVAESVERLLAASSRDGAPTAIDLSGLSFVDAAGAGAILRGALALDRVPLADPPPLLRRVWQVLGYDEHLVGTTSGRKSG